ncbi:MAG: Trk system potassium transporter TrkA [Clostridia bacterium]|nr:Trk system potassium transporter TrkA [Clostridia bacterium]
MIILPNFGKEQKMSKTKGLSIIIVGAGKVGETLVEKLVREGHDITIVDKNAERVQSVASTYDVMGLVGNGAIYSVQLEAGIEEADLLIAVTGSDELNLLCCTVAKRVANCESIARVRNPDYVGEIGYLREKLGLTMIINPELEAAREAARILYLPTALEVSTFAHGQAEMVRFKIPEKNVLDGMKLIDLGKRLNTNVLISAVERGKEVYIPTGDFCIQGGDVISIVATGRQVRTFLSEIGFNVRQVQDTMIIGGGMAAYYLADRLIQMGIEVKIIERSRERCEELSLLLPRAIIINGDGTNEDLLKEEGVEYVQSFVPLTGIDEENILLTLHARHVSNAKVITKINRITFRDAINTLDLGSVIYPRHITSERIVTFVRAKKNSMNSDVETLYHLFDSRVEAIEFRVKERSDVTGIALKDLKLKKDLLISFINRNGSIIMPSGNDKIEVGDTVMIVTKHSGFNDIQDILE